MKKIFSVAFAALMALGSLTFVSCDKENDAVIPQTEQNAPATKRIFPIEPHFFTDAANVVWYVWGGYGHVLTPGSVIELDIKFRHAIGASHSVSAEWHFTGTVEFDPEGNCTIHGATFRLTPELKEFLCDYAKYWLHI